MPRVALLSDLRRAFDGQTMMNPTIGNARNGPPNRRSGHRPGPFGSPGRVLALISLGVASVIGSGCEGACEIPTDRVTITLPDDLEHDCEVGFRIGFLVGTVSHVNGHLAVVRDGKAHEFPDLHAEIPDGTLVQVLVDCNEGRILIVQNLPSYDAQTNPTEPGTRLWALLMAGQHAIPGELPIDYALEEVCKEPDGRGGNLHANAIIIADGSTAVIINPGEKGEFEIHEGDQAGRYSLENVSIVFADDDYPLAVHLRLLRAD